ncbi:hypothetical protein [Micromonospora sp. NPDC051141]|uniref:hypothetical protein n=1 Tax=Micromonospora sp. NPDC051141 TaxID=3364284 RepID=UPI00379C7AA6
MNTPRTTRVPLASINGTLQRLRRDIDAVVEAGDPDVRADLVAIHYQVRLLGQHLNAALGASAEPIPPEDPR